MAAARSRKKAVEPPAPKFEDLTVGECLALIDGLCEQKAKYVRYGKDFRRAWEVMQKLPNHRQTMYDALDHNDDEPPFPSEMLEDIKKYFKPKSIPDDDWNFLLGRLDRRKLLSTPKTQDEKFAAFMTALKIYVEAELKK